MKAAHIYSTLPEQWLIVSSLRATFITGTARYERILCGASWGPKWASIHFSKFIRSIIMESWNYKRAQIIPNSHKMVGYWSLGSFDLFQNPIQELCGEASYYLWVRTALAIVRSTCTDPFNQLVTHRHNITSAYLRHEQTVVIVTRVKLCYQNSLANIRSSPHPVMRYKAHRQVVESCWRCTKR